MLFDQQHHGTPCEPVDHVTSLAVQAGNAGLQGPPLKVMDGYTGLHHEETIGTSGIGEGGSSRSGCIRLSIPASGASSVVKSDDQDSYTPFRKTSTCSPHTSAMSSSNVYEPLPSYRKRDSKVSLGSATSAQSHQEYLDSLRLPSPAEMDRISSIQEKKEQAIIQGRLSLEAPNLTGDERKRAARLIQKQYRGYRTRRQMNGMGLDPSSRWVEAVREARYRNLTTPRARADSIIPQGDDEQCQRSSIAMQHWKKLGTIARRAAGDEESDDPSDEDDDVPEAEREKRRQLRIEKKRERAKHAQVMGIQYWLESTDLKHRYGFNLRTYHEAWVQSDTNESFFYWLDHGEGRYLDCAGCTRERLDKECIRYLSREERQNYLVKIDKDGRLRWAKNGQLIDTTTEYRDSINGIVPENDPTPAYTPADAGTANDSNAEGNDSAEEEEEEEEDRRANKYMTPGFDEAKGVKKVNHLSASTIINKLLRSSVQKNTWIYVADTSFRLFVGIKQSGAFQHSSFLHGSRISSAGLLKVKDGKLTNLSPLSGHYRPPTSSFKAFVSNLTSEGVDMKNVSISRSYTILVGLEAYMKTRKQGKKLVEKLINRRDKILDAGESKKRDTESVGTSSSTIVGHRPLEEERESKEDESVHVRLLQKLGLHRSPREGNRGGEDLKNLDANGRTVGVGSSSTRIRGSSVGG